MTLAETRLIGINEALVVSPTEIKIGPPKIYTPDDVDFKGGFLTVKLAGKEHKLPIKTNEHGIPFAWLNPDGKEDLELKRACALETGFRLARKMDHRWAVMLEAPSKKSTEMANDAGAVAVSLTGKKVFGVQLGGEEIAKLGEFFDQETSDLFSFGELENGKMSHSKQVKLLNGQQARVIRYKPITNKDKFMFITEEQFVEIRQRVTYSALTVVEDVVSKGTTTKAMQQLLDDEGIREPLEIIAVAREGEWVDKSRVDFAIQLPLL